MSLKEKKIICTLKKVFRNPRYTLIAILIAITFYSINAIIRNWKLLHSINSSSGFLEMTKVFASLVAGFGNTIKLHSHISLIIISILFGVLFSLILYKTIILKASEEKIGILGSIGIFIGVLAPGCAACGVGLISLFGVSAATLALLPLEGLEFSILAILILVYSTNKISKSISKENVCVIK